MCRIVTILTLCILVFTSASGQRRADNWLFGERCWVNFSSGQPVVSNQNPNSVFYGSMSMSDNNGNLLYYGSGFHVNNKLHQPMPQSPLQGQANNFGHPILTIPYPGHDSLYYVFYAEFAPANNYTSRLLYAIINMNAQNGLGDIIAKDVPILGNDSICVKYTAALHCNKRDIWVIGHYKNSDKYYSLLVTPSGINAPVISTGSMINDSHFDNNRGYMKVSPTGDKMASAFMEDLDMIEVADFNSQTGQLSNFKVISTRPSWTYNLPGYSGMGPYGVEFSPSGKYLYVSSLSHINLPTGTSMASMVFQFDMSGSTAAAIQSSQYMVDSANFQQERFRGTQLANDGKIYVSNTGSYLHAINNPEGAGAACNFVRRQILLNLGQGGLAKHDLPVFIQSYFRYPVIATGNCQFQNISFSIQNTEGISAVAWDFGDPASGSNNTSSSFNPTHIYTTQGTYVAKAVLTNSNGCGSDTITKVIHSGPFKVFLGNDTTICQGDTLLLKMNIPAAANVWNDFSTDTLMEVTQPGTYWVRVNIGDCVTYDSITVSFQQLPVFSLGSDTTICNNQNFVLTANFNPPGASYVWNNGSTAGNHATNTDGTYWLELTDAIGCSFRDSILVQYEALPNFSLGVDTVLCQSSLSLDATVAGATSYQWNTGAIADEIIVNQSGIFWADVTKDNCTYRDSISISFKPYPAVSLGADTILCTGTSLLLDAGNPGATYQWQDNSAQQTQIVSTTGLYHVAADLNGCMSRDTIRVSYNDRPGFTLGPDLFICNGQELQLVAPLQSGDGGAYVWQDGSSQPVLTVRAPGLYTLEISNICGAQKDSLLVAKGACKLYVPNAFTPNHDGLNDIFRTSFGEDVTSFSLEVYNRWGQKLFAAKEMLKGWNGYYQGKLQPEGVYVWLIRYKSSGDPTEKILKGTVLIIR